MTDERDTHIELAWLQDPDNKDEVLQLLAEMLMTDAEDEDGPMNWGVSMVPSDEYHGVAKKDLGQWFLRSEFNLGNTNLVTVHTKMDPVLHRAYILEAVLTRPRYVYYDRSRTGREDDAMSVFTTRPEVGLHFDRPFKYIADATDPAALRYLNVGICKVWNRDDDRYLNFVSTARCVYWVCSRIGWMFAPGHDPDNVVPRLLASVASHPYVRFLRNGLRRAWLTKLVSMQQRRTAALVEGAVDPYADDDSVKQTEDVEGTERETDENEDEVRYRSRARHSRRHVDPYVHTGYVGEGPDSDAES